MRPPQQPGGSAARPQLLHTPPLHHRTLHSKPFVKLDLSCHKFYCTAAAACRTDKNRIGFGSCSYWEACWCSDSSAAQLQPAVPAGRLVSIQPDGPQCINCNNTKNGHRQLAPLKLAYRNNEILTHCC